MRLPALALVLAVVPAAAAQGPADAYGFHVGLSADGGSYALQWFARASATPTATVGDATFTGTSEPVPGGGAWVNTVVLDGLAPGRHAYEAEGFAGSLWIEAPDGAARLGLIGDQGVNENAVRTTALLADAAPDAVLHAGDLAYAHGDPVTWDAWFEQVEPVASNVPWLPALGNHETYTVAPTGAAHRLVPQLAGGPNPEVDAYKARFALPGEELWWSWDVGPVHVVAVDTFYSPFGEGSAQAAWLVEDLATHAEAAWTVVFLHEPAYSSNAAHGSSSAVRDALVPLFEAGGVDLVVAAHDHAYERTWPLRDEAPVKTTGPFLAGEGVVHLVTGGGGNGVYAEWESPQPEWSAVREAVYHVVLVDATPSRLDVRAVGVDGRELDAFAIEKPWLGPPPGAVVEPSPTPGPTALLAVALAVGLACLTRRGP